MNRALALLLVVALSAGAAYWAIDARRSEGELSDAPRRAEHRTASENGRGATAAGAEASSTEAERSAAEAAVANDRAGAGSSASRSTSAEESRSERLRRKGLAWPVKKGGAAHDGAAGAANEEPEIAAKLAYRALWYLGVDPEAERTWLRAINDPRHDTEFRSDLILDMVDEGYTDNNNPTQADLPLILARLELIERYAPYAMDEVNARAFESTYQALLEMYLRLGGRDRG